MTRKKKLYIVIGIVLSACVIIYLAYVFWPREKNITGFYNNDPSKITKIEITSGSDGEIRTITDVDDIKKITDILSTATFQRTSEGAASGGWLFDMNIYEGDDIVFNLYKSRKMKVFNASYNMSEPEKDNMISLARELLAKYE